MSRLREFKSKRNNKVKHSHWQGEVVIERLADDGRGVGKRDGKVVFVEHALPGEQVLAKSLRSAKRFDEATCLEVIVEAKDRVAPACAHYAFCGGCQLQHLNYPSQVDFKQARFTSLLERLKGPVPQAPLVGESLAYRHRVRLAFQAGVLGFKAARSHDVVAVVQCEISQSALNEALQALTEREALLRAMYRGEIDLAIGEGGEAACRIRLEKPPSASLLNRIVSEIPIKISSISTKDKVVYYSDFTLQYPLSDTRYRPGDFTQVNPAINAQLVARVMDWLSPKPDEFILDAFSGLGNFSRELARHGARVIGLEGDAEMVARAREQGHSGRLDFRCQDLFAAELVLPEGLDAAVLDPPRAGAESLCQALIRQPVSRIAYISCDPSTLERDAQLLLAGGYTLEAACWADMFPQTRHMEALMLFTRSLG